VKTKERIKELYGQGINLAIEVERLKRKIREYIEKVEEIEKEGCEK